MKVVLLAGPGDSTWIIANALKARVPLYHVIVERPPSFLTKILGRLKRLSMIVVFGQLLFLIYAKILKNINSNRIQTILNENSLDSSVTDDIDVINVDSANSTMTISILQKIKPDVVVVNGTRILSKQLLDCIPAQFVNMHAGITPKYRGVHGAYWALALGDKDNAGVTIHLVDQGIDTGDIIYQRRIKSSEQDDFSTYPYLQIAQGLPWLVSAVEDLLRNSVKTFDCDLPSQLYYHPTIWGYLYTRYLNGVK